MLAPAAFLFALCLWATLVVFVPWLFMYLWNITMPQVFRLTSITYWQAFRLLLMASMLFGGASLVHFTFNR